MVPHTLEDIIRDLYHRIAEQDRRTAARKRTGLVKEVDAGKGLVRVVLGPDPVTGREMLSPWIPWQEQSMGKIKTHFPPSVGEQVDVVSETGDLYDASVITSIPSDDNKRPHDKEGETVIDMHDGKYRQLIDKDGNQVEKHKGDYKLKTDGIVYINCSFAGA